MILKLAFRNILKNKQNYLVYLLTMVIALSLVSALGGVACSEDIMSLAENMAMLKTYSVFIVLLLSGVIAYLTTYVCQDLMLKRSKEMGILALIGFEKKKVSKLFRYEFLVVTLLAFVLSIPLAFLLQLVLIFCVQLIFNTDHISPHFYSGLSMALSLMFLSMTHVTNIFIINNKTKKYQVFEQLQASRKRVRIDKKQNKLIFVFIALSLCFLLMGLIMLVLSLKEARNVAYLMMISSALMLGFGVFGVSKYAFTLIAVKWTSLKIKGNYGKGLVVRKNLSSKLNKNANAIGVLSILLTLSLVLMMLGLSIGASYKDNIKSEAPFDIAVFIDHEAVDFEEVIRYIEANESINRIVDYKLYDGNTASMTDPMFNDIILLSDYNRLRKMIGLEAINLKSNELAIHVESKANREKLLNRQSRVKLQIGAQEITNDQIYSEPFSQYGFNGLGYLLVIDDVYKEELKPIKSRLVVSTNSPAKMSLKGELKRFINLKKQEMLTSDMVLDSRITMGVIVKSWSNANGLVGLAILSFISLYVGIIFIVASLTLLAIHQTCELDQLKRDYKMLQVLGYSESDCSEMMKRSLLFYFIIPSVIPIMVVTVLMMMMYRVFSSQIVNPDVFVVSTGWTLLSFIGLYVAYFKMTLTIVKYELIK